MTVKKSEICVVIPAFNRAGMLLRAVKDVLSQSYSDFHLVVVDDASTEDLKEVKHFVTSLGHDWLRLEENSGPARARNVGAAFCEWEWISFLDSDDEWHPGKLEQQVAWHRLHSDIRISQVKEKWIRNGREVNRPAHWKQKDGYLFKESVQRCSIGPSGVMIRRDLWEESGGFNEFYRACEDYELWLRICSTDRVGLIPGDFLTIKNAGHGDQLSTMICALDRYRVLALLELLEKGDLSGEQRDLVVRGVTEKSIIMAKGAAKRGSERDEAFYRKVAEQTATFDWDGLTDWIRHLRAGLR